MKNIKLISFTFIIVFFNSRGYSVNSDTDSFSERMVEDTNTFDFEKEFYQINQLIGLSRISEEKLRDFQYYFQPYSKILNSISRKEETLAMCCITAYELYPYFKERDKTLMTSLERYMFYKINYQYKFDKTIDHEQFISSLPDLIQNPHLIALNPSSNPTPIKTILERLYYHVIDAAFDLKESPLKTKLFNIHLVIQPYLPILNHLTELTEINSALNFIFAYEYGHLLLDYLKSSHNLSTSAIKIIGAQFALSPTDETEKWSQKLNLHISITRGLTKKDFEDQLITFVKLNSKSIFIPIFYAHPQVKEIFDAFMETIKNSSSFFCFETTSEEVVKLFHSHSNEINHAETEEELVEVINNIIDKNLKFSHFEVRINLPSQVSASPSTPNLFYEETNNNYFYLKVSDFKGKFLKYNSLKKICRKKSNLILDLRNNLGGEWNDGHRMLQYFIPADEILCYFITKKYENSLNKINFIKGDYSVENMKYLIEELLKHNKESKYPLEILGLNYARFYIEGKIAILINEYTGSTAELVASIIKNHDPERVKIIGTPSAGAVIGSRTISLSDKVSLRYPGCEIILKNYTRLEDKPIQPDIILTDPEETMKAAEEWVKLK